MTDAHENQTLYTQLETAYKALEYKDRLLEAVLNSIDISFFIADEKGHLIDASSSYYAMCDYTKGELIGRSFTKILIPEQRASAQQMHDHLMKTGFAFSTEWEVLRKDSSLLSIQVTAELIEQADGSKSIVTTVKNKVYQEQVNVNEKRFRALVENGADVVVIISPNGRPSYVSPSIEKVLGYTEKEALALDMFTLIHPDDVEGVALKMEESLAKPGISLQGHTARTKHKDGSWRWLEANVTNMLHDPLIGGIVDNFRDVTEKKQVLDRLRENEAKLMVAQKIAKLGYWQLTLDGNQLYWSDEVYNIWGVTPEAFTVNFENFFNTIHPDDREAFMCRREISITGQKEHDIEHRILLPDGSVKWVHEKGKLLKNDAGKPLTFEGTVQDITERKQMALSLEESNQRYVYVTKATFDAIWDWDLTSDQVYWGEGFFTIFGHDVSKLKLDSSSWTNHIHPDDLEKVTKSIETIIQSKEDNWMSEYRYRKADGSFAYVVDKGIVIRNKKGKGIRMVGAVQDISKQKKADLALKEAYAEKNTILESIGDAFFAVDKQWIVTYWNKEAENVLGTKRENIVGHHLWEKYTDALDLKFYTEYHRAMNSGEIIHFEEYYPSVNSWFEVSAYPSAHGLSVYFKDVNLRKTAEEHIRLSNERFEKISEATNDAIWDFDVKNNKLFWGKGFSTLFKYDLNRITPTIDLLLSHIHPEDRDRIAQKINQFMNDGSSTNWFEEYRFLRSDGSFAFVIDRAIFIRDHQGQVIRVVGAMTDISYRIEYEESLKKLNLQLQEHARELEISNAELAQFAYVASHDLQEPLRMVSSFMTQLEKKYGELLDERGKKYIGFAVDGAKRMRQIILDLLEFSRVGRMEDKIDKVDLTEMMQEIQALYRKRIEESKAILKFGPLPHLCTYRSPLRQVFQNLVSNALKYYKEGVPPIIHIAAEEKPDHWQFSVSDNGIGIDPEYFDKIFIIFQRLHSKDEYSGTGMGLSMSKKIVENLGGEIWLESEEGKGSTFYFTIAKVAKR